MAFYNSPTTEYKCAYIKIIDYTDKEKKSEIFDGPLLMAYSNALEYIFEFIKKKMADFDNNRKVFREMLANAVFHKDYDSFAPITVKLRQDEIEFTNPCKKEYLDINHLNNFDMPTNPINGCLSDIALKTRLMEGQGRGEETLKKYLGKLDKKPYELICNILRVKIPLN